MGAASVAQVDNGKTTLRVFNPHFNDINLASGHLVASACGLHGAEIKTWSDDNDNDKVNVMSI